MNSRERVLASLNHTEPDKVPLDIGGTGSTQIHIRSYKAFVDQLPLPSRDSSLGNLSGQTASIEDDVLDYLSVDVRGIGCKPRLPEIRQESDGNYYTDEWGITRKMPIGGWYYDVIAHPLQEANFDDLAHYPWPDPNGPSSMADVRCEAHRVTHDKGCAVVFPKPLGNGFLQMGCLMMGYEQFMSHLLLEPRIAEAFMDKLLELKSVYWDRILEALGDEVDVIYELDDLGSQENLLVDPKLYRKMIKPRQRALFSLIKKKAPQVKILFHSDGAIYDIMSDLIEVGVDILNPLQYSAAGMDATRLKREFGNDLVFWGGGIDTQEVLPKGTPAQVRDAVRRQIDILAPGGGFVFATVHNIQGDVPAENIMAMWEAFQEYRVY